MKTLENIQLLKKLTKEAEEKANSTRDIYYQTAYKSIASGTALLWRLIDQDRGSQDSGTPVLAK
jgi:hypothetical protein